MSPESQLEVRNLSVAFRVEGAAVRVVHEVSFSVRRGETLALVGESGSGKSVTSLAVMRLTPSWPRTKIDGEVLLRGRDGRVRDLLALPEPAMREVRGNEMAMIFQEPLTSLNPVHTVGDQIAESLVYHRGATRRAALARSLELLELVGISEPRRRLASYPHQLSGGMRQRVMIAIALACDPSVLIADEPTTALDVTVQAQILELIKDLQARTGMSIIFITHNLGVVAEIADRIMVMYAGRIVEEGGVEPLLLRPRMPYTMALLRSVPTLDVPEHGRRPLETIGGQVPSPTRLPSGCSFHARCGYAVHNRCDVELPPLAEIEAGHRVRCLRAGEIVSGEG
jgi:oligopeptide transport system ATP-binding protein